MQLGQSPLAFKAQQLPLRASIVMGGEPAKCIRGGERKYEREGSGRLASRSHSAGGCTVRVHQRCSLRKQLVAVAFEQQQLNKKIWHSAELEILFARKRATL